MKTAKAFVTLALAAALAAGCVVTTTPGGKSQGHWIGDYDRAQARDKDADRQLALRVRKALSDDPQLQELGLRIFAHHGEVTLCGGFPNDRLRARATAIVSSVDGVDGVDTDCPD